MAKEKIVEVLCSEPIMDWSLWPRSSVGELDSYNLKRMKQSLQAGQLLPPIIACRKSKRIVDGFHRRTAIESLYGFDAKIQVIFRDYKDEKEMFLEACELNSRQGVSLKPRDIGRCLQLAKQMGISDEAINRALGITDVHSLQIIEKRMAVNREGSRVPVSGGAETLVKNLNGKKMNVKQETYVAKAGGMRPMVYAAILLRALEAEGSIDFTERNIETLRLLENKITQILGEVT